MVHPGSKWILYVCIQDPTNVQHPRAMDGARDTPRFAFAFATGFGVRADSVIDIDSFV